MRRQTVYDESEGFEAGITTDDLQMEVEEVTPEGHSEEIVAVKAEKISASDVRRKIEDYIERRRYRDLQGEELELEELLVE